MNKDKIVENEDIKKIVDYAIYELVKKEVFKEFKKELEKDHYVQEEKND